MPNLLLQFLNLSLRGLTLLAKFILIFYLARTLPPSEVGIYGIFVATVIFGLYFLGFDFYIFSTRELIGKKENGDKIIASHFWFMLVSFIVFSPLIYYSAENSGILEAFALFFVVILFAEFFSQELFRMLVARFMPLAAGFLLFLRHGLWVYIYIFFAESNLISNSINNIFLIWGIFGFISIFFGTVCIGLNITFKILMPLKWFKKGLLISVPFFVGTIFYRSLFVGDRYIFEHLNGANQLGAYVFFSSLTISLLSFVDAAIFSFKYPGLIKYSNEGNGLKFMKELKTMLYQTSIMLLILTLCLISSIHYVLEWIGESIYQESIILFYLSLISSVIFTLSMIPHYGLYAMKLDKLIIIPHIISAIIFLLFVLIFSDIFSMLSVPISLILSFLFLLFCKTIFLFQRFSVSYQKKSN